MSPQVTHYSVGQGAARRDLRAIVVTEARTTDLGVIPLEPESTIRGRVILKEDLSASGLRVWLDEIGDRLTSVSFDGRFFFDGVASGEHVLILGVHPPEVLEPTRRSITVAPGRPAEVVFDLTTSPPCTVELTILEGGRGVSGLTARWVIATDGFEVAGGELGKSDRQGIVHGPCPSDSRIRFEVLSPAGVRLGRSLDTPILSAGGFYLERLDLKVGSVVLILGAKLEIPESGCVKVLLEGNDGEIQVVKCCTPGSRDQTPGAPMWIDNRLELGEVAVGEYQATVSKHRTKSQDVQGNTPAISIGIGSTFEGSVKVEEGKVTIIEVP